MLSVLGQSLHCSGYLIRAGYGQMEILWNRRPIAEVLKDDNTPVEIQKRLEHVERVRAFAAERLGLDVRETYTTYTDINREAAAWNVSASRPLAFQPKTWWFPIVGTVPYLGFFDRPRAEAEAESLRQDGWDVIVSDVAAYSTLGWFNDPLLSSQMSYSESYLTSLVIHESAHATIWFPGDVSFNESFASFVEREGARQFDRETFGPDSAELLNRIRYYSEAKQLSDVFHRYALKLQELYNSDRTDSEKTIGKSELIAEFQSELKALQNEFKIINTAALAEKKFNNAHFLSHLRYESGQEYFQLRFDECNADWTCFFKRMRELNDLSAEERRALLNIP
ncbi:MAG: aminopeptidase [Leptospiraceae bacterium]|nr:aminopeptidase [Leptospiraceae bacterium]